MPGRVGQKSFVYVASEPYFLVSTLITPLHNKDLAAHHGGQPPEQDRSHENRNNRDSGGFCSGGCQKVSWDVAHTYIEVEFYRICNVEKFRPCNLSPGGQTPRSQPKRRARHTTVRRTGICEEPSAKLQWDDRRPGQQRKDFIIKSFKSNSSTSNRTHTERQYSELNHVCDCPVRN